MHFFFDVIGSEERVVCLFKSFRLKKKFQVEDSFLVLCFVIHVEADHTTRGFC